MTSLSVVVRLLGSAVHSATCRAHRHDLDYCTPIAVILRLPVACIVLVHVPCWCTRRADARAVLVHAPCWCTRRAGARAVLVHAPCWCTRRAGVRAVLMHAPC